jgi:hypothetical protein
VGQEYASIKFVFGGERSIRADGRPYANYAGRQKLALWSAVRPPLAKKPQGAGHPGLIGLLGIQEHYEFGGPAAAS